MNKKKVLLVDDEKDFLMLLKARFEANGYEVLTAANGKDGIKLAKKTKPHIILLDLLMPGMDGLQSLEQLKKDPDTIQIPVIMLSAKGDESFRDRAAQLYDEMYITKPVDWADLKAKVEEILKIRGIG